MTFEASFIIVTWVIIALLTLGLMGCIRMIRQLSDSIDTRLQSPLRLEAGHRVRLPSQFSKAADQNEYSALLFVQAECTFCLKALDYLTSVVHDLPTTHLLVFWRGDRHPRFADVGMPHAGDAFHTLHISLTPFFVLLKDDVVLISSRVGSTETLDKVRDGLTTRTMAASGSRTGLPLR